MRVPPPAKSSDENLIVFFVLKREMNSLKKAVEEPMTKYVASAPSELRDQLAAAGLVTADERLVAAGSAGGAAGGLRRQRGSAGDPRERVVT